MTEVTGASTRQINQASDDYAFLLDQELHRTVRTLVDSLPPNPREDDLYFVRTLWQARIDRTLASTLALLFHTGAAGVRDQLRDALTAAASRTLAEIPQVSPQLVDAYLQTAANRLAGVADLLWEAARDQLREGQAAGESQARLAQRIRKATGLALPRAKVIARTEARDALLAGALNQVRATGLTGTKRWIAVRSYKTRPTHRHAHGQEVDLRGFFEVGGWPLDRPHDPLGPPEETISCRCGLAFSLDSTDVTLAVEPQRAQADQRLLKEVWDAGLVRQGVTQDDLTSLLLDLGLTASVTIPSAGSPEETTMEAAVAVTVPETDTEAEVLARKSEDDDCPPGQAWDPEEEECVDLPADEELAAKDAETAGGEPNPGTGKDGRLKDRKGPAKRKKKTKRDAMAAEPDENAEGAWEGILTVEGIPTGDGREFAPDSLVFADFPLPLTYQPPSHGGEPGPAIDVGVIDQAWRDEQEPRVLRGRGRFDMKDPIAADYFRKVDEGFLRGMSVDLDDSDPVTDVTLEWSDAAVEKAAEMGFDEDMVPMVFPPSKKVFHKARVRGAALLSMPAFVETQMVTAGKEPPPLPDMPLVEKQAREAEADKEQKQQKEPIAVTAAAVARLEDYRPPVEWFQNPQLGQETPIVVTDDLRVYGHAFTWEQCHIGYGETCITPPEEEEFAFYTQGTVVCAGGEKVPVGSITLGMGHAPVDGHISPRAAAEHYDNTDAVVADVAIGADRVGGWVAGWIRPGTDPKKVYALRAAGKVSGDWRMIGGRLRLVALLAVNVPGFPIPRPQARVASGQVVAMTAAGLLTVGPRVDWQHELEQLALKLARDKALAAVNDDEEAI